MEKIKNLPSAAWQAFKNYFAGLRLFFNRQTWMHGVIFIIILIFFLAFHMFQPNLRILYRTPLVEIVPIITNAVVFVFFAGIGVFLGYLILGVVALLKPGRNLLYESKARHIMSPIIIGGLVLSFITIVPYFLHPTYAVFAFPEFREFFNLIFFWCWIVITLLQVILLAYSVIKVIKWLWGYLQIPDMNGKMGTYSFITIFFLIVMPIAILAWYPVIISVMIGEVPRIEIPPGWGEQIPGFVLFLLRLPSFQYVIFLWLVFPIVVVITAIVLWRRFPRTALAIAGFGLIYPTFVYYYRFKVVQYFISWYNILTGLSYVPRGTGAFEMGMLLLTFALILLGAAKVQREVSPNPFGLYAIMIGTLNFALFWIFDPDYALWLGIEFYNMVTAALSALLAVAAFVIVPLAYCIYWLRQKSSEPVIETVWIEPEE